MDRVHTGIDVEFVDSTPTPHLTTPQTYLGQAECAELLRGAIGATECPLPQEILHGRLHLSFQIKAVEGAVLVQPTLTLLHAIPPGLVSLAWSLLHGPHEASLTSHLHALRQHLRVVRGVVVLRGLDGDAEVLAERFELGQFADVAAHLRVPHRVDDGDAEQRMPRRRNFGQHGA